MSKRPRWMSRGPSLPLIVAFTALLGALFALLFLVEAAEVAARSGSGPLVLGLIFACVPIVVALSIQGRRLRRQRLLRDSQDLDALLAITPSEFEERVALILEGVGYRGVAVSGGRGDRCVDITGRNPIGARSVIQCKQHALHRMVGSPEVQTFIAMAFADHSASKGVYVTTASYTEGARELAWQHRIELIDGPALVAMARRANVAADNAKSLRFADEVHLALGR